MEQTEGPAGRDGGGEGRAGGPRGHSCGKVRERGERKTGEVERAEGLQAQSSSRGRACSEGGEVWGRGAPQDEPREERRRGRGFGLRAGPGRDLLEGVSEDDGRQPVVPLLHRLLLPGHLASPFPRRPSVFLP